MPLTGQHVEQTWKYVSILAAVLGALYVGFQWYTAQNEDVEKMKVEVIPQVDRLRRWNEQSQKALEVLSEDNLVQQEGIAEQCASPKHTMPEWLCENAKDVLRRHAVREAREAEVVKSRTP